jgi:hypothetical protein
MSGSWKAQSGDTARTAKARVREAERDRVRHERATKDAALQAEREAHANAARRQRDADDDAAARDVVAESPDASKRDLIALIKARRTCGYDRAVDALNRINVPAVPAVPAVLESHPSQGH